MLGQYGLLYALEHEDQIDRLFILNTPLATNSKLRPELAAYKSPLPFLRPGNVSRCSAPTGPLMGIISTRAPALITHRQQSAPTAPAAHAVLY